jgi:hypothetical protein
MGAHAAGCADDGGRGARVTAMNTPLGRFVLKVLVWLPVAFVVWYFAAPLLLWPVKVIVAVIAHAGLPDLVTAVEQSAAVFTFATSLKPGEGLAATANVTVDVDGLLYSFGMPLFAALVLSAREPRWARTLAIGYAVQIPFVAWGVLADFLKNVAITAAPLVVSQTGFSAWQREAIVFAFQFGSLILPTVVPAVVWVLTHRAFLERLRETPQRRNA